MRQSGRADSRRRHASRGHVCCVHDRADAYRRRLVDYFADGLRDGLRVTYACPGGPAAARADLADLGDLDRLVGEGAVHVVSFWDVYGPGGPVDAEQVVAGYAAATERALADGYRGLRAGADATELLRTPHHRDAMARYEFLVDRYMASHPLSALCGFATELGTETVTEFQALHDPGPSGEPAFRVFGCPDGALGLGGQFDPVTVGALRRVLDRLRAGADAGVLVIDMADVEYVDHRLLLTLSDHARATGVALSVRSAPPFAARLADLLPASSLRLSEVGAES